MSSNKAQEEMVGFVLIVVLVAIIALIFLSISLRQGSSNTNDESQKIGSLIGSLSQLTTACEIPESNFLDISNLIRECSEGDICDSCAGNVCGTNSACEVLRNTLFGAMEASYKIDDDSYAKYYSLKLLHKSSGENLIEPINSKIVEECLGNKLFNVKEFGDISMEIEICFS